MIRFILAMNVYGKVRLSRWYVNYSDSDKQRLTTELNRQLVSRGSKYTNFIEFRNYKIVYRRFKALYIAICIDVTDNELAYLEFVQLFVEVLDNYFGEVKELDLIFSFNTVYAILDEMIIGGEIMETSIKRVVTVMEEMEKGFK